MKQEFINHYTNINSESSSSFGQKNLKIEKLQILRIDKRDKKTIVYMTGSYLIYQFQDFKCNGKVFVSSGPIPVVMVYAKNNAGEYILEDYETTDGDKEGYFRNVVNAFSKESKQDIIKSMASSNANVYWKVYTKAFIKAVESDNLQVHSMEEPSANNKAKLKYILKDCENFFRLTPRPNYSSKAKSAYDRTNLEEVLKHDIIHKNANLGGQGEVRTEGHKILRIDKKDRKTIVYLVSNYAQYGFQNGIFTIESGAFGGKSVMIYSKNSRGEYVLDEYKKPAKPSGQVAKKIFPVDVQNYKLTSQDERQLILQQETYAKAYLKSIGRKAVIQSSPINMKYPNINADASNKLWDIDMYSEYPNWIGTLEKLENGQRYVYETKFKDKGNGNGIVSFIKRKYGGSIVKKSIVSVGGKKITYIKN